MAALRERYAAPEYALLPQVRNATGWSGNRTADALAMSLWPSRGLDLHGFEIKVSRSDWLREKKDPAKAESIAKFCDRWWIAAGGPEIVGVGELPPTWGLLVLNGSGKLVCETEAPKLDAAPLTREFLAAALRVASTVVVDREEIEAEVRRTRNKLHEEHEKREADNRTRHAEDLAVVRKAIADFETASGVRIDEWRGAKRIGEAVRLVLGGSFQRRRIELEGMRDRLRALADGIGEVAAIGADEPTAEDATR